MHIQYALYERIPKAGFQWTWRADGLTNSLLGDFQYRIKMPTDADTIFPDHLRGGILKFAHGHGSMVDEHVVLYRFYNGGSDEGRSRVTMLTAWIAIDQLSAPSEANGLVELFHNSTFKHVSNRARTVGIERPYSLIGNEPLPTAINPASAELAEFLRGIADQDFDYSLTIDNDTHVVQKTPSVAFTRREEAEVAKRQLEDEQRQADQMKQLPEPKWHASGFKNRKLAQFKNEEHPKVRKHRRSWLPYLGAVGLVAASALFFLLLELNPLGHSPEVSPPLEGEASALLGKQLAATKVASPLAVQDRPLDEAQNIVMAFKKLPPEIQRQVLADLHSVEASERETHPNSHGQEVPTAVLPESRKTPGHDR